MHVIVTARDEADRLAGTLAALRRTFPQARVLVADDGSRDATAQVAAGAGAQVVSSPRSGKGAAATRAARCLAGVAADEIVLLCDADLGDSVERLQSLVTVVDSEEGPILAVADFVRRLGGGFGIAVGFARWALRRRTGLALSAPISGQRALRAGDLQGLLPFADGFGMEMGMTIAAVRRGMHILEVPLELEHRATGRTPGGFAHRARQLTSFVRVYLSTCRA